MTPAQEPIAVDDGAGSTHIGERKVFFVPEMKSEFSGRPIPAHYRVRFYDRQTGEEHVRKGFTTRSEAEQWATDQEAKEARDRG